MRSAVISILVADVTMSLDNVLAVAGAAHADPGMLIFGLALSIALMAVAANFVANLLERHRWLAYLGVAVVRLGRARHDLARHERGHERRGGLVALRGGGSSPLTSRSSSGSPMISRMRYCAISLLAKAFGCGSRTWMRYCWFRLPAR